jgi:hypothetical protein
MPIGFAGASVSQCNRENASHRHSGDLCHEKTQPESAMQRDEPQKGAKEAFILRFLCYFASFTIKCGFTLGGNSVSVDSWLQAESSAYPQSLIQQD